MKRLACLVLFLLVPLEAGAQTPPLPPLPAPTPLPLPNCPMVHYGTINGIWYWGTGTCPSTNVFGFGQTNGQVDTGCKATSPNECKSTISPVVPFGKGEAIASYGLNACSEPDSTPMERDQKLQKIIKECEKLMKHLGKLKGRDGNQGRPGDISQNHRDRIAVWVSFMTDYIAYLKTSTDTVENKIDSYCKSTASRKSFIDAFRDHEAKWNVSFVDLGSSGKRAYIRDVKQVEPLVSADAITPTPGIQCEVMNIQVYKVVGSDISGGAPVYFKVFTFREKATPGNYTHYGIQVSDAGSYTPIEGKLKNRNTYGHLLGAASGSAVYLVSSWDDLSIPEDP